MVDINNRGRGFVPGWFTVEDVAYLPDGSPDRFAATFEQHCHRGGRGTGGSIALDVAPSGPTLTVTQNMKATGTVGKSTGSAIVRGSVTCLKPTYASVGAILKQ